MSDVNLNNRQAQILEIVALGGFSRDEISQKLVLDRPITKITLIRDLNYLIRIGKLKTEGVGRGIKYFSNEREILRVINSDKYFVENSATRKNIKSIFNFKVFNELNKLFDDVEKKNIVSNLINLSSVKSKLDSSLFKREIERFTVEFAWKSSKIEGNTYTLLETESLIKNAKEAVGRSKYESEMILNHKKAIDFILDNTNSFKKLTIEKVIELHSILIKNLEVTEGIRDGAVAITGTDYVPMSDSVDLKNALLKMIDCINKSDFPLEKALIAISMVTYIQAFFDGNKRTARTLANAILLSNDYLPLSYRDIDEIDYVKNMILFYEQNTLFGIKKMIINQFQFTQKNYFKI